MGFGPNSVAEGNLAMHWAISAVLSPAIVAPNTSAEQTFTVKGLHVGDFASINKPTSQAGLTITGTRVSAADTLAIAFGNLTAATITPTASETYIVNVVRAENLNAGGTAPLLNVLA